MKLRDAQGQPLTNAVINISGGMPGHGHGLPTSPVAVEVGSGLYQIKGLKFTMGGEWVLLLDIMQGNTADQIVILFNL